MAAFERQIERFRKGTNKRMRLVYREATKQVADRANTPQAKRGRLPVDTGFLRASQSADIGQMPSGPARGDPGKRYRTGELVGKPVTVVIAEWKPGEAVFIGWTAAYARFMEYRYGFMQAAAEKWPGIVLGVARKLR